MEILHGYFDESGTHAGSQALAVAGYLASAERWMAFEGEWRQALDEFAIPFFHMSPFCNRAKPYDTWTEESRRERFQRLIAIINRNVQISIGTAISPQAFQSAVPKHMQNLHGGLYGLAASHCAMQMGALINASQTNTWVAYTFEDGAVGSGETHKLFTENIDTRNPERRKRFRVHSVKFESKKAVLPLQAADIIAYELYRHLPKHLGTDPNPARTFHTDLLSQVPFKQWGYLPEAELQRWAQSVPLVRKPKPRRRRVNKSR